MKNIIQYFNTLRNSTFPKEIEKQVIEKISNLDKNGRSQLRHHLFSEANKPINVETHQALQWLQFCFETIDKYSFRFHKVYFSPGPAIKSNITNLLAHAKKSVDICVFTITDDELGGQIIKCHQRGVKVRIITDDEKTIAKGSEIFKLENLGIPIKIDHSHYHMHNKFGIIDNRIAITGSFNWTYTATKHNQENLLATSNYSIVNQYNEEFERLWQEMYKL